MRYARLIRCAGAIGMCLSSGGVRAQQPQVYLTVSTAANESLIPPSPLQDIQSLTLNTLPAMLTGATLNSSNSVHTGGYGNSRASGAIGSVGVRAFAYEPYGYDEFGHEILLGGVAATAQAQFTERIPITHPTLPVATVVQVTLTYTIAGSRTIPDQGDFGAFSTYGGAQASLGDGVGLATSPTWVSTGPANAGKTITLNLSTLVGRTLAVTCVLLGSASVNSSAVTLRSVECDYVGRASLSSSTAGVRFISQNGYNFGACPGDLNGDQQVDDADFVVFVVGYNILDCADPAMPAGCPADLNGDRVVDDADFVGFVTAYNNLLCP